MPLPTTKPTLAALLPSDLTLGEPDVAGALAVYPLLGTPGTHEYLSFAEASAHGCSVRELSFASVNNLLVANPLDLPVLLFEGEEVKGAQQDRTFDITVLVAAGSTVKVPVSCVEHGRWDGSRHDENFMPSPAAAYPSLREVKNRRMRTALAMGAEARADQGEVWEAVAAKAASLDTDSDTGAMGDIYAGRADELSKLEAAITRREGQLGALACVGGQPAVLDFVSRPEVFAALWKSLLRGYCLDALECAEADAEAQATEFLDVVRSSAVEVRPGLGLGEALTFTRGAVGGAGLAVDDECVQLSAFAHRSQASSSARILRPSRRR